MAIRAELSIRKRQEIRVSGMVQGVGFRPWVFRRASMYDLAGSVWNDSEGLRIVIEGAPDACESFLADLRRAPPRHARVDAVANTAVPALGELDFRIRPGAAGTGEGATGVLPDMATCSECLAEIFDPGSRRYRYPFTACTQCGPRYSIIKELPYDRPNTSMSGFSLCDQCQAEYRDPHDRRFHAQPMACPQCGPVVSSEKAVGEEALREIEMLIRDGGIAAVKGLGGFHLICDARNDQAVRTLRQRKNRPRKPFALLSLNPLDFARVSDREQQVLASPQAPIVLLTKKPGHGISESVAPGLGQFGVMLPSNPLHHLLAQDLGFPLVATSGNRAEEPLCVDNHEARRDLCDLADGFLVHDRPILNGVDDSIVRVMNGSPVVFRNARGYAPQCFPLVSPPGLAVGGRQKNAVAVMTGRDAVLGPYVGTLETDKAVRRFEQQIETLTRLYSVQPEISACDLHPDDEAARYAPMNSRLVQHHHAHVVSCMLEHNVTGTVLGVAWDGTGYGEDGTVWGGEFLLSTRSSFERAAHLRPFRLPGGEAAIREPARCALGLLAEAGLSFDEIPGVSESYLRPLAELLEKKVRSPVTASAGRLFDGVAALLGFSGSQSFEGEAAMWLENAAIPHVEVLMLGKDFLDWSIPLRDLIDKRNSGVDVSWLAGAFHNTLADMILHTALKVGQKEVVLTGGCFQNAYLTERTIQRLGEHGFRCLLHGRIPPNDSGLAAGQAAAGEGGGLCA